MMAAWSDNESIDQAISSVRTWNGLMKPLLIFLIFWELEPIKLVQADHYNHFLISNGGKGSFSAVYYKSTSVGFVPEAEVNLGILNDR